MKSTATKNRGYKMATSTAVPAATDESVVSDTPDFGNEPVKSENVEYVRFQLVNPITKDKQGNAQEPDYDVKVYASPSDKLKKELLDKGYEIKFVQSVVKQTPGNPDGLAMIISDPEEMVGIFVRGLAQKLQQITNRKFSEDKSGEPGVPAWTPTEDAANFSTELNEKTNRRNLSEDDRLRRDLRASKVDEEDIIALFAARAARAARKAQEAAATNNAPVAETATA